MLHKLFNLIYVLEILEANFRQQAQTNLHQDPLLDIQNFIGSNLFINRSF